MPGGLSEVSLRVFLNNWLYGFDRLPDLVVGKLFDHQVRRPAARGETCGWPELFSFFDKPARQAPAITLFV
jgi:hypothetical protein